MSQYPGAQPPGGPYYGSAPTDPYAQPQPPVDPYFGAPAGDPYAQQAQYQAWQAQQQGYQQGYQQPYQQPGYAQQPVPPPAEPARARSGGGGAAIAGIFLVVLGAWFLFRDQVSFDLGQAWPLIAVVLGVLMIIGAFIPRRRG
jgi:hypothetical protein